MAHRTKDIALYGGLAAGAAGVIGGAYYLSVKAGAQISMEPKDVVEGETGPGVTEHLVTLSKYPPDSAVRFVTVSPVQGLMPFTEDLQVDATGGLEVAISAATWNSLKDTMEAELETAISEMVVRFEVVDSPGGEADLGKGSNLRVKFVAAA